MGGGGGGKSAPAAIYFGTSCVSWSLYVLKRMRNLCKDPFDFLTSHCPESVTNLAKAQFIMGLVITCDHLHPQPLDGKNCH